MHSKYNRTFHLPWSKGASNDDKIASDISSLINIPIVISEKIDGGNCSLEHDYIYARTHSKPADHPSFDIIKAHHANIKYRIPKNIQLFGENVYALHSIAYTKLPGYFLLFNVRDTEKGIWESWDMVEQWAEEINVPTVPILFKGSVSSIDELKNITEQLSSEPSACGGLREGVVVRIADSFKDDDFSKYVSKWVREGHVDPNTGHWALKDVVPNKLI